MISYQVTIVFVVDDLIFMTYKYVEKKVLKDTGWIYGLKRTRYIVSYCEVCRCQRVHYYVRDCFSKILFECSFCKENKNKEGGIENGTN